MSVTSYIQGHDVATLKSHQSRTAEKNAGYLLDRITPTSSILDIGCGPGAITCDFARYASRGDVVGLDYSGEVLDQARKEAGNRGLPNVTFQSGDAHKLPFSDDSFDIVHCHAVLIHLPDPANVMKEMRRVCKAGGYVAAREPDWDTCAIHPESAALNRWKALQAELQRGQGSEPNAGRHLTTWAVASGFPPEQIVLSSDVLLYSGKEEVNWWGKLYATRVKTEFGKRALESGKASTEEIEKIERAYLKWSDEPTGVWAMMHMSILCQK